jgi:hypothetical protein
VNDLLRKERIEFSLLMSCSAEAILVIATPDQTKEFIKQLEGQTSRKGSLKLKNQRNSYNYFSY